MLVHAALVPGTALLVPGVAGRVEPDGLAELRSAAVAAVAAAVAAVRELGRLVVVAPAVTHRAPVGTARADLGAVGVPDPLLRWPVPTAALVAPPAGVDVPVVPPRPGVGAAVALHLLAVDRTAGTPSAAVVLEVANDVQDPACAATLRRWGAALVADGPTALVVVGSGSARHGPEAPLADDPAAPAWDDALHTVLAADDGAAALAALDPHESARLAVSGWAPWQVLAGACAGTSTVAGPVGACVLAGAAHAVATWTAAPR